MVPLPLPASSGFLRERADLWKLPMEPSAASRLVPPVDSAEARLLADTWNACGGLLDPLSAELGIEPGLSTSVLCVESSGRGLGPDGCLLVRFECHVFFNRWGRQATTDAEVFRRHFRFDHQQRWKGHEFRTRAEEAWQPTHHSQQSERQALALAREFDDTAALCSTSMGSPQVMGFHHARIGYPTVQEMFAAFGDRKSGERAQILGLFDFIRGIGGNSRLLEALRQKDILGFAGAYNGPGQAAIYAERIARYAQLFQDCRDGMSGA